MRAIQESATLPYGFYSSCFFFFIRISGGGMMLGWSLVFFPSDWPTMPFFPSLARDSVGWRSNLHGRPSSKPLPKRGNKIHNQRITINLAYDDSFSDHRIPLSLAWAWIFQQSTLPWDQQRLFRSQPQHRTFFVVDERFRNNDDGICFGWFNREIL